MKKFTVCEKGDFKHGIECDTLEEIVNNCGFFNDPQVWLNETDEDITYFYQCSKKAIDGHMMEIERIHKAWDAKNV